MWVRRCCLVEGSIPFLFFYFIFTLSIVISFSIRFFPLRFFSFLLLALFFSPFGCFLLPPSFITPSPLFFFNSPSLPKFLSWEELCIRLVRDSSWCKEEGRAGVSDGDQLRWLGCWWRPGKVGFSSYSGKEEKSHPRNSHLEVRLADCLTGELGLVSFNIV